jgi:hypothetical protein
MVGAMCAAGCSGGDKPGTLPLLSSTPTPSATSATPSAHQLEAEAEAVVRRYFILVNAGTSQTVADQLTQLMTASCSCQRVPTSLRNASIRKRQYFGSAHLKKVVVFLKPREFADALVDYDTSASGLRDSDGTVLQSEPASRDVQLIFRLVRQRDQWLINEVTKLARGSTR